MLRISPEGDAPAVHDELVRVRGELAALSAQLPGGSPEAADARVLAAGQGIEYRVRAWRETLKSGGSPSPGFIDGLAHLWEERRALAAERADWHRRHRELAEREEVLEELLGRRAEVVRAHRPGTVLLGAPSAVRMLLREEDPLALSPSRLLEALRDYVPGGAVPDGAEVSAGQPLARLVVGWDARMAVLAPGAAVAAGAVKEGAAVTMAVRPYAPEDARGWDPGGGGTVPGGAAAGVSGRPPAGAPDRLRGEVSIKAVVAGIGPEDGGTGLHTVVLDITSGLPDLVDEGFVYAVADWGTVAGAGVPKRALVEGENPSVLMRTSRGGVLRTIVPVWEDEEHIIAEGIAPGERVLLDPGLLGWITWRFPAEGE